MPLKPSGTETNQPDFATGHDALCEPDVYWSVQNVASPERLYVEGVVSELL